MSRLALGTAQFGLNYGIANRSGKVPRQEVRDILDLAIKFGIDTVDTAMAYGDSEKTLGILGVSNFRVVTKIRNLLHDSRNLKDKVIKEVENTLRRLNVTSIYGLLLHNTDDLFTENGEILVAALIDLKKMGLICKYGVSVYQPQELRDVMQLMLPDLVQLPLNLMDRRFEREGLLKQLTDLNIEIHARSIFLQGLLLMPYKDIPVKFRRWDKLLSQWEAVKNKSLLSPSALCLSYPLSMKEVDRIVVGVDNLQHLKQLLSSECNKLRDLDIPSLETNDLHLINPSTWNTF